MTTRPPDYLPDNPVAVQRETDEAVAQRALDAAIKATPATVTIPKIFLDCCADEESRYSMTHPFVQGDYICATNGHIGLRVPISKVDWAGLVEPNKPDRTPPNLKEVFEKELPPMTTFILPEPLREMPCDHCNGNGKVSICETCDGEGSHECECGDDHTCKACRGTGKSLFGAPKLCHKCRGTKVAIDTTARKVGRTWIAERYCKVLRDNGVTEVSVITMGPTETKPVRFRLGDVEGLVMPTRPAEGH